MFTQEEAEKVKRLWKGYYGGMSFLDWLDAHTESPLTFPCPGCRGELEITQGINTGRYWAKCKNHNCPIKRTKPYETKERLAEALNKEA